MHFLLLCFRFRRHPPALLFFFFQNRGLLTANMRVHNIRVGKKLSIRIYHMHFNPFTDRLLAICTAIIQLFLLTVIYAMWLAGEVRTEGEPFELLRKKYAVELSHYFSYMLFSSQLVLILLYRSVVRKSIRSCAYGLGCKLNRGCMPE